MSKARIVAFEVDGEWGVEERYPSRPGYPGSAVIYDAQFSKRAAICIAQLLRRTSTAPEDWHATHEILRSEGFSDADLFPPASPARRLSPSPTLPPA